MKQKLTLVMIGMGLFILTNATQGQVLVPFDQPPSVRGNTANADVNGTIDTGFFLQSAWMDNKAEILKGELVASRASGRSVKDLAQTLVSDHKRLESKLEKLADRKAVILSKELDSKQKAEIDALSALSGPGFDKAYLADQVMAHTDAIALYERAAAHLSEPEVKSYAETALPMLRKHLDMLRDNASGLGMTASGRESASATLPDEQK